MVSKRNKTFILKLMTALVLSSSLVCPAYSEGGADFSYFSLVEAKPIKLINPIYLDTSQGDTVRPKANTSIPFNLRSFSESDYFSSSIDDEPKTVEQPTQPPDKTAVQKPNPPPENTLDENTDVFTPLPTATDFFSPLDETSQEGVSGVEIPSGVPDINTVAETDSTYTASVNTEDVDLEGKTVTGIKIKGLNTVRRDFVLSKISTQVGSLFNPNLLQQDLQKIYATGYFTDEMSVEPTLKPDGTVDLAFVVNENVLVTDVSIIGNTVISTMELMPFVVPMKNMPQNLLEINSAIDKINGYYHEKGYILANVDSVDDDPDGALNFSILEGVINKIDISGNEKTRDYVITRNVMTQAGTVYNEEFLKKDLSKIYSTQIFDEVDRNITPCENEKGKYDVTIAVKEKSTDSVALGGGIDTGLGAFGSISLREDNFLGKAQKVSLSGILGSGILLSDASIKNRINYQVELSFFEPYFLNADNSLMGKLYYRELGSYQIPLAIERRMGVGGTIEHKVRGYDNLTTSLSAGVEHIHLKEGDYNRISELYALNNLNIADRAKQLQGGLFLNLAPGVRYSTLDNNEIPRDGVIAQARFTEAFGVSDFKTTNGRLAGTVTKFFPVFKKSSFSLTAKGGIKVHGDHMPEVMAYRLGGPYSIRGFKMNGVGSGDSFIMGTAELATPIPLIDKLKWDIFKNMRLTFFMDAGKVFDPTISSTLYDRPLSAITMGVGLRVYVPGVGPISVDYGLPLTNPGHYGSKNGYFTFGTGGMNFYGY